MNDKMQLASALHPLIGVLEREGVPEVAGKLAQLDSKLADGKLAIAFCGHFSAGKSTLLNRLCGTQILPTNPIPTSANIVTIRSAMAGERARANITLSTQELIEVEIQDVDDYCKDGIDVRSIELVYPIEVLGEDIVVLDTPGVDSTDEGHRLATESALHIADVVFYVMDYNHVMSEINFTFAKQLQDWGKPLYVIVNQIDKHREIELSFDAYRNSVEEGFANWHLQPAGILYLSLREPDHLYSEYPQLLELIGKLRNPKLREQLSIRSVYDSTHALLEQVITSWHEDCREQRDQLVALADGIDNADSCLQELAQLEEQIRSYRVQLDGESYRVSMMKEIQSLLENANVTPAVTRDLAAQFLQAYQPGWRAGMLFAGARTDAEKKHRLEQFVASIVERMKATIEFHLHDLVRREVGFAIPSVELEHQLASTLQVELRPDWFVKQMKPGATYGNEYVLNYCRDVANELKSMYRKLFVEWVPTLMDIANERTKKDLESVEKSLLQTQERIQVCRRLELLDRHVTERALQLTAPFAQIPVPFIPALPEVNRVERVVSNDEDTTAILAVQQFSDQPAFGIGSASSSEVLREPQIAAAHRLDQVVNVLASGIYPSLNKSIESLRSRALRLRDRSFTIALFGAFSAGKSSLANALLGERVLPVSPNPTTATVNRIEAPHDDAWNRTARVKMKSRISLLDDLKYSLTLLGEDVSSLEDEAKVLSVIQNLQPQNIISGGRAHYRFLKAVIQGWSRHESQLGKELTVDEATYRIYVAEEEYSCFVQHITLYHDNPLTRLGIVLVDTPGADSINARHTDVAFNYIRNADAILFVTYYNHAFAQADRQFLMQLGRVKDQFELDKMFFLVNAADLAADQQELEGVIEHVLTNLQQNGIRHPRLFPISSLDALDGKVFRDRALYDRSGIAAFEHAFTTFVGEELGTLAVQAADEEGRRAIATLREWASAARGDAAVRGAALHQLAEGAKAAEALVVELRATDNREQLVQEMKELLFYVGQRVQYRFGEFYGDSFHPSHLQEDGRNLRRTLWVCWLNVIRMMQIELAQELQATSLRLDRAVHKFAAKRYEEISLSVAKSLPGITFATLADLERQTVAERPTWTCEAVLEKQLWTRFRSPKTFFEGGGRKQLRDELERVVVESLSQWLSQAEVAWDAHYRFSWIQAMEEAANQLQIEIDAYVDGRRQSLSGELDLRQVERDLAALEEVYER